ncbi:MAG: hypothetical protein RPG89_19575 [Microcystis panniformis WG22]|nr:hypothetical protein [Microcystis panniformis WG22]
MTDFQLTTPVAFLIFNRPDTTARVFEAIRQAKPPKLLVVADGPRPNKPDDIEKCKAARAIIDGVDWDCEVLKNYSEVNLGCKRRVSSGLDWVFETVEEAIILEDDCLPHPSFFRFCQELLNHYQDDKRIMAVSGDNFQPGSNCTEYSYYFSRYPYCWGWATWRRAWKYYDIEMKLWEKIRDGQWLKAVLEDAQSMKYWTKVFQDTYDNKSNNWGYRWLFACFIQSGLAVIPRSNLVSNIGFTEEATHTKDAVSLLSKIPTEEMSFPLQHPPMLICNKNADNLSLSTVFKRKLSISIVIRKMQALLNSKYLHHVSNKFVKNLPYNLADQNSVEWGERSLYACKIALDYLNDLEKNIKSDLIIGDFGCGNQRVKVYLNRILNSKFTYRGYDILPQSDTVTQINFDDSLPEDNYFDLVFCLGLLEYIHDLSSFFKSLRKVCQSAIISYIHKSHYFSDQERTKLGWINHYTIEELEAILISCGFKCVSKQVFNKQVIFLID